MGQHLVAGISDSVLLPGRDPLPGTTMTNADLQHPYILLLTRHTSGRIAQEWTTLNIHYIGPNKPWATTPITKEFFSFSLWHAAAQALLPGLLPEALPLPQPPDLALIRPKTVLYTFINPRRGAWYRRCLASCVHWQQFLQTPAAPFAVLNDSAESA